MPVSLVSFDGAHGTYPYCELVFGSDGKCYGTTCRGGSNNLGTVFRVTTNGALTLLVLFGYGLGNENDNLPAFVVLTSGGGGQRLQTPNAEQKYSKERDPELN